VFFSAVQEILSHNGLRKFIFFTGARRLNYPGLDESSSHIFTLSIKN